MDRFSPVAPAYVRVLVLPVGHIERSRFFGVLSRLQSEASIIRLAEIVQYSDHDELLSPKASPHASILYNYATSMPSEQQQQLSPFELFREPLLVLGIVDGLKDDSEGKVKEMEAAVAYLRERHPRVVHRQLLILDEAEEQVIQGVDNAVHTQHIEQSDDPALKEAVCQLSARFLAELATYTRAMQASPSIQTPGQTARSLQRTNSLREQERRPASGHSTPSHSSEVNSPVDESGSRPPPFARGTAATSFDQVSSAGSAPNVSTRPDSRSSNLSKPGARASSQDRVSVQGFGSNTSQEKVKQRGKARVGIVVGSIYLMAGQWSEALRMLVENTTKARMLADHIWHAKGLESIVICLLLHAWAGMDFVVPSVCHPITEKTTSGHVQRFSVNLPQDFNPTEAMRQAPVDRLATLLPDLFKLVLSLYRSGEGSLELPFVAVSEATVRFCKLLTIMCNTSAGFSSDVLDAVVRNRISDVPAASSSTPVPSVRQISRAAIADLLSQASPVGEESVAMRDKVTILTGIVSAYSSLRLNRKKALIMRDLMALLTAALIQARKRGAAEMGIHPAASLSADTGADGLSGTTEDSNGMNQMMAEFARIYGIQLPDNSKSESQTPPYSFFNHNGISLEVFKGMIAFCEASPNLHGLLRVLSAFLRHVGPNGTVDTSSVPKANSLSKDEQAKLTATIGRAIGVSKRLGLPEIEAAYWDPFLVRDVGFVSPDAGLAVLERSKLGSATGAIAQGTPANPLLYDPNAARTGSAAEQAYLLVQGEMSECLVTLQNPYDVPVDVVSLTLVTHGVELKTSHQPITLQPLRLQQISLSVSPSSSGDCKITHCIVKISGCAEQMFSIMRKPWSPLPPTLIKAPEDVSSQILTAVGPENATVSVTVIDPQPLLSFEDSTLLDSSLMLLDGEKRVFNIRLRNSSNIPAVAFDVVPSNVALRLEADEEASNDAVSSSKQNSAEPVLVQPGGTESFAFSVIGKAGVSSLQVVFSYSSSGSPSSSSTYARLLSVPIRTTVNAALQAQRLDVSPIDAHAFMLSFELGNAWPKPISYSCAVADAANTTSIVSGLPKAEGTLAPGEIQRVFLPVMRSPMPPSSTASDASAAVLGRLRVVWRCESREGVVDLSRLALSPEAQEVVRGARIHISLELADTDASSTKSLARSRPRVKAGSFVTLRAKLVNRSASSVPLLVHLQPRAVDSLGPADDQRRVAVVGASHRVLPPISKGEHVEVDFAICPLLSGAVHLEATAKPAMQTKEAVDGWDATTTMTLNVN